MRVSSMPPFIPVPPQAVSMPAPPPEPVRFLPFSAQAFHEARTRHVPVFLVIAEQPPELRDGRYQESDETVLAKMNSKEIFPQG